MTHSGVGLARNVAAMAMAQSVRGKPAMAVGTLPRVTVAIDRSQTSVKLSCTASLQSGVTPCQFT